MGRSRLLRTLPRTPTRVLLATKVFIRHLCTFVDEGTSSTGFVVTVASWVAPSFRSYSACHPHQFQRWTKRQSDQLYRLRNAGKACKSTASSTQTTRTTPTSSHKGSSRKWRHCILVHSLLFSLYPLRSSRSSGCQCLTSIQTSRKGSTSLAEKRHLSSFLYWTTKSSLLLDIPGPESQTDHTTTALCINSATFANASGTIFSAPHARFRG